MLSLSGHCFFIRSISGAFPGATALSFVSKTSSLALTGQSKLSTVFFYAQTHLEKLAKAYSASKISHYGLLRKMQHGVESK